MARYLIIAGRFNEIVTKALVQGAEQAFEEAGHRDVATMWVPGSFDIPCLAANAARSQKFSGIVCLGAVIRGETAHFDYVAGEAARGLMSISIETGIPISFGILTTDTVEQALNRSGLKGGNKGKDAAQTVMTMHNACGRLKEMTS